MKTETPAEFHQRMWLEHGPKPHAQVADGFGDFTPEVRNAITATQRLVRGQVADRLAAILGSGRWTPGPSWTLDDALEEVERRVGALRTPLDIIKAEVRDAALEEAALRQDGHSPPCKDDCALCRIGNSIRALKSKPATCGAPYGGFRCSLPTGHAQDHQHTIAPQPSGTPGEFHSSPEPVHDIGWARARVMDGKRVRSPSTYADGLERNTRIYLREDAFEATDWEVAE